MTGNELAHGYDSMPCTSCGALENEPCKPTCPTQTGK